MGERVRALDWEATPLGGPAGWPQSLKTAVRLLLSSGHPMFIWWGPDLVQFYNDAYRRSIGPERHPSALGDRGQDCWAEIWDIIGPQIEQVMSGGGPTWHENQLVPITRNGRREDVWWTYSYSPIDDPHSPNGVGGVLVICSETTERITAEQKLEAEREDFARLFAQAPTFMAMLQGPEHRIELANPGYIRLIGGRDVIGRTVAEALPEAVEQGFVALLDQVYSTGVAFTASGSKYTVPETNGGPVSERYVDFVYQPLTGPDGSVTGIFVEGADVTDRTMAEAALRDSEERFRTLADYIPTLCWMADPSGNIFWYNSRWYAYTGASPEEQAGWGWQSVHDPKLLPSVMARWTQCLETGEPFEMTFPLKGADGRFRPFLTRVVPLHDDNGAVVQWFGTNTDITEETRQGHHLRLMVDELNHRVKNTLAIVQSVTEQTLRGELVPQKVRDVLVSRLLALSRAHDVLTAEKWTGADLREIAALAAAPYQNDEGTRLVVTGPSVFLRPSTAIALALSLHELATNAAKYGALSGSTGTVDIRWEIKPLDSGDRLLLSWRESGGPAVTQPSRRGFGSRLIERGLAAELDGSATISYPLEGVFCSIEAALPKALDGAAARG